MANRSACSSCRSQNDFEVNLSNFCGRDDTTPFDFGSVYDFIRSHRFDLSNPDRLKQFCDLVIPRMSRYDCPNLSLVVGLIDLKCALNQRGLVFCWKSDVHIITERLVLRKKETYFSKKSAVIAISAIVKCDIYLMKIIVKYNIRSRLHEDSHFYKRVGRMILEDFAFQIYTKQGLTVRDSIRERSRAASKILLSRCQNIKWSGKRDSVGFRRTLFVLMGIKALTLEMQNSESAAEAACALRMYFQTITEPYVTLHEVEGLLSILLEYFDMSHVTDELRQKFLNLFPESNKPYQVRSLYHHARCATREQIRKSGKSIREVMKTIYFPEHIRRFILCDFSDV